LTKFKPCHLSPLSHQHWCHYVSVCVCVCVCMFCFNNSKKKDLIRQCKLCCITGIRCNHLIYCLRSSQSIICASQFVSSSRSNTTMALCHFRTLTPHQSPHCASNLVTIRTSLELKCSNYLI